MRRRIIFSIKNSIFLFFFLLLLFNGIAQIDASFQQKGEIFEMQKVEIKSEFSGGEDSLMSSLRENIRYLGVCAHHDGEVVAGFVVEKDGDINDIVLIKSAFKLIDDEAIRVVKAMSKRIPEYKMEYC